MAAVVCSHCGGSNPSGAAFCQYCGSQITAGAGAPLPQGYPSAQTPLAPPPSAYAAYPPAAPPPRGSGTRLWKIVVIIVVVIFVVGVLAFLLLPGAPAIQVGTIVVESADNVCGLDGATASGFNASTGNTVPLAFGINGTAGPTPGSSLPCNITSLTTSTAGFNITGANLPLVIPANATETLIFNVVCPGSPYTGDLTLVMN